MAEKVDVVCSTCHVKQAVVLPPNTKSIICERCLAVIHVVPCNQIATQSHSPPMSPYPDVFHSWEHLSSSSSSSPHPLPHTSLESSESLPPIQHVRSSHHAPIPSLHPLSQLRSASMSRTQNHEQPHFQHQATFKGTATDFSMLDLPEIVALAPKPVEDYDGPHSPQVNLPRMPINPFLPLPHSSAQTSTTASNEHAPTTLRMTTTKPPHALPTHGTQLYRQPSSTPNPLQYTPKPTNAQGAKRAVIVGISYQGTALELKGCLNDAKCMRYLLTSKFHFPESAILLLTDDQVDPRRQPTKYNIMQALHWLVHGCQAGDSLVFHFSGHGSQQPNYKGEELDGYDETLVPVDFMTAGQIVDDNINTTIVRPLPPGVNLHAIVDACHSGTVLDLPFLYRYNGNEHFLWEDHRPATGTWKGTAGGNVYSFSGCDDHQTVFDCVEDLGKVTSTGEMTYCFIQAIERGYGKTYGSLLNAMRSSIHMADNQPVTSLIDMLLQGGSYDGGGTPEPQLTSSRCFDVSTPFQL